MPTTGPFRPDLREGTRSSCGRHLVVLHVYSHMALRCTTQPQERAMKPLQQRVAI